LDQSLISKVASERNYHKAAEFFIYGFDDNVEKFYSIGFNSQEVFCKIEFNYNEVRTAHDTLINKKELFGEIPVWVDWYVFSYIEPLNQNKIEVQVESTITTFENYLNSIEMTSKLRPEIIEGRGDKAIYGFDTQKEIIKSMSSLLEGNFYTDYRHIHILYEHKKLLISKMNHTADFLNIDINKILSEYTQVLKNFQVARVLYLKGIITDNSRSIYDMLSDVRAINRIIKLLENSLLIEQECLAEFVIIVKRKV
jgi:hypothetical protein